MITISRRTLAQSFLSAGVAASAGLLPGLTFAAAPTDRRLVVVVLRGGMDGLMAVPPFGDPDYAALHGALAVPAPGGEGGARDLDGFFGLHPALEALHGMWTDKQLAVVHAVASPYRERSHFDGQDVLESGGSGPKEKKDGWLNRALAGYPRKDANRALAVSQAMPLILTGGEQVSSWTPPTLPSADADLLERIRQMYAEDGLLSATLEQGLETREMAQGAMGERMQGGRGPQLGALTRPAGALLKAEDGARFAVLDPGGWDTHANQQGQLTQRLTDLDRGLGALKESLGPVWARTLVIVVTEFGRTVRINGTGGTDHGTAGAAFMLGGALKGGRMLGDWPGLGESALHEGRDLAPATDMRALFKTALIDHMGLEASFVESRVFPGSKGVDAFARLV